MHVQRMKLFPGVLSRGQHWVNNTQAKEVYCWLAHILVTLLIIRVAAFRYFQKLQSIAVIVQMSSLVWALQPRSQDYSLCFFRYLYNAWGFTTILNRGYKVAVLGGQLQEFDNIIFFCQFTRLEHKTLLWFPSIV